MTFKGDAAWGYRRTAPGGVIISPASDEMPCLFDLKGSIGTRLVGLTLDGQNKSKEMHGVYSKHTGQEQNIVIANNSLYHASMKQLIINKGRHKNAIIKDYPGSLRGPGYDTN
jgi:hypothetical protein